MELELARADRYVHAVSVAAGIGERPGDRRLGHAEQPQHATARNDRPRQQRRHRRRLADARPQRLELARGSGQRHDDPVAQRKHDRRCGADEPHPLRAVRERRLLADPVREVRVRPVESRGDRARKPLDRRLELLVDVEPDTRCAREQLDRAVVMGRAEAAGDDEQVV